MKFRIKNNYRSFYEEPFFFHRFTTFRRTIPHFCKHPVDTLDSLLSGIHLLLQRVQLELGVVDLRDLLVLADHVLVHLLDLALFTDDLLLVAGLGDCRERLDTFIVELDTLLLETFENVSSKLKNNTGIESNPVT